MIGKFNTILFIFLIFTMFYPGQILLVVHFFKISPLQIKFARSQQAVRTCKALAKTENWSK